MASDICVPEPSPTCSGIAVSIVTCKSAGTLKARHNSSRHFLALPAEGPLTVHHFASDRDNRVACSLKAIPMLPNWRPRAPLKSKNPMCNLAGAITDTLVRRMGKSLVCKRTLKSLNYIRFNRRHEHFKPAISHFLSLFGICVWGRIAGSIFQGSKYRLLSSGFGA